MDPLLHSFILDHQNDDTDRLLLARRDRWPGVDVPLAVSCIQSRRKLKDKLPSWYGHTDLILPLALSAEQCSSERTAAYKASYAAEIYASTGGATPPRIADLTGGLGVDSAAFSAVASAVLYNEMNPALVAAARHNFPILGAGGIIVSDCCISPSDGSLKRALGSFGPDIVFLDPARRSAGGRKVFRLSDCTPDVLTLKEELLDVCGNILLKISPMADISQVCRELGGTVREIRIVESCGECKELLVWLCRGWEGNCSITVVTDAVIEGKTLPFRFTVEEESGAVPVFVREPLSGYLFEPGKAFLKSGAFNLISTRFNIRKFAPSTHLYLSDDTSGLAQWGRVYAIEEWLPMSKAAVKDVGSRFAGADVTARNAHMTSDELSARLGKKRAGNPSTVIDRHIFAAGTSERVLLMVCRRV